MRRPIHSAVVPLFVLASAAASSCILLVDEAEEGAGGASTAASTASVGGGGGSGGGGASPATATSTSGAGGGGVCYATVTALGNGIEVADLDEGAELALSVVSAAETSSAVFVRLGTPAGTIRRFQIVPGNSNPISSWFDAPGAYVGARLAPAPDDEVLVTHEGAVFKLVADAGELAQESDLPMPGGLPALPDEAVEVGGSVYVRAGINVYRVGDPSVLVTNGPVNRLTANADGRHWIANANVVYSCSDDDCSGPVMSTFFESLGSFPVFTVRSGSVPIIFLRTSSVVDPAFVGPVGAPLVSTGNDDSPLARAVSAAFVGEHLVVVRPNGDVHACCVDGVPSCGPESPLPPANRVAASPGGERAVLAFDQGLQLITVTP